MYNLGCLFLLWVVYYTVIHFFYVSPESYVEEGSFDSLCNLLMSVCLSDCLSVCLSAYLTN